MTFAPRSHSGGRATASGADPVVDFVPYDETSTSRSSSAWPCPSPAVTPNAGIKIPDTRMMRLMEVLLDGGNQLGLGGRHKSTKPS
jgi:hypothetical protein